MGTVEFYLDDYGKTLFPLATNRIMVQHHAEALAKFINEDIKSKSANFRPQTRVHAAKKAYHLRRTVKLDPVAEYFLYDLVFRNRKFFKTKKTINRRSFGYCFNEGIVPPATDAYRAFRKAVVTNGRHYQFCVSCDIASYFNSLYHHDLVHWFEDVIDEPDDVTLFGRYLREINAGRSVDCLPQGIVPAKVIGSHFLSFVDVNFKLKSASILRFMDDFYLFDDAFEIVLEDFAQLQMMLGEKALSINPAKTKLGNIDYTDVAADIDLIKLKLLRSRREIIRNYGEGDEDDEDELLDEESRAYLLELLKRSDIEEEDAELVLTVMRDDENSVLGHLRSFLDKFPSLTKSLFHFAKNISDKQSIMDIVRDFVAEREHIPEYQLFWLANLTGSELKGTREYGKTLTSIYEHDGATDIVKAKVLEMPEDRFGLPDLREGHLRTGDSNWLAWASATGIREMAKSKRNHLLGYFANGGPINRLVAECIKTL
jgi:hypothetical protein